MRKPARQWILDVEKDLADSETGSNETLAAACNSLALLLLKCRQTDDSLALCRAQYGHFLKTAPELAVQPWINIGRIFLRTGRRSGAPEHFFLTDDCFPQATITAGNRSVIPLSPDTLEVCRNVRIVDGLHCVLSGEGLPGAFAFLARLRDDNPGLVYEMDFRCALLIKDKARADRAMHHLRDHADLSLLTYLSGLAAAYAGETSASVEAVLTLAAMIADGDQGVDYLASILHAIDSIFRVLNPDSKILAAVTALPAIMNSIALLGDVELMQRLSTTRDSLGCPFQKSADFNLHSVLEKARKLLHQVHSTHL